MNNEQLIQCLEQNIKAKFSYIPSIVSSMEVLSGDAVLIINSKLQSDMFNITCCLAGDSSLSIDKTIAYFQQKNLPAAWWVGFQDDCDGLVQVLESHGLQHEEAELAMAASLDTIPELPNSELMVKLVNTHETLLDFTGVIGQLVPDEAEAITNYFTAAEHVILHPSSRLKLFVGYLNDKPVSTASAFLAAGLAGIFDIIALPDVRGKGVGSTMTIAAMQEGKDQGYDYASLTATDDAKFVYEKLGFQALKEMCVYAIR